MIRRLAPTNRQHVDTAAREGFGVLDAFGHGSISSVTGRRDPVRPSVHGRGET